MYSPRLVVLVFSALIPCYESGRILGLFPLQSRSHFGMYEALMKALVARGHELVVVSNYPQTVPVHGYTDIDVSESSVLNMADGIDPSSFPDFTGFRGARRSLHWSVKICKTLFLHPKIQALLNSGQEFDLVLMVLSVADCIAGLNFKFRAPQVGMVTSIPFPWVHDRLGNPDNPSYTPSYFVPYTGRMDFWQRLWHTLQRAGVVVANHFFSNMPTNALLKQCFGEDVPAIEDILGNTSVVLVNTHFSITESRPTVPGYVEVGGLHIRQPKPLPRDIEKFINDSEHGVVYLSMGSTVQLHSFPHEKLSALLEVLGNLPERVLMKYMGSTLPWKPDNIMIKKWFPQIDILCHPKTKLFISHGGLFGCQEAIYTGVPIVGIPLFAEQELNINWLEGHGMAVKLVYDQINKDNLLTALRSVMDHRRYSDNAVRMSALFRDRPMSAMDTAVYWVEYVMRHRGAPHLRSAATDMPLYQYLLLDVIGFLLPVLAAVLVVCWRVVRSVLRV